MIETLTEPVPWEEAFAWARRRINIPTTLGHDELLALRREFDRRALILARVANARVLSAVRERVSELAKGIQDAPGNYMDPATFRLEMREILDEANYRPEPGREGTISDLRTHARLKLIADTEEALASGRATQAADLDPDVVDAFPAWELYRAQSTKKQRDWKSRWRSAAHVAGDRAAENALDMYGRMIARKDSGIWKALGSATLFDDALNTDHPPFAFESGMDVKNVNRMTAIQVGVFRKGDTIHAKPMAAAEFKPSMDGISEDLQFVINIE